MRPSFPLIPVIVFGLGWLAPVAAQEPTESPLLWVVESDDGGAPTFLYGTIHLPDDRVLALPEVVSEAVEGCDALYTEIPMDMATQMGIQAQTQAARGETLREVLSEETYARLDAYLKAKNPMLSAQAFNGFKVWVVTSNLEILDYLPAMMRGVQPLDSHLYSLAEGAGKEVGGIETPEEQLAVFDSLSLEEQIEMMEDTLDRLEEGEETGESAIEQLLEVYLEGDLDAIQATFEAEAESDPAAERFMQALLTDRNHRMAERIAVRLRQNPNKSYFFAVGAAHYPGDEGILELLESDGFSIRRLTPADAGTLLQGAR
jgi:uncharacterized protein